MNLIIFDTETTSLQKPFCYNVGYQIIDTESLAVLTRQDYVIEQIWHNLPLFSTAYYAEKRPIYVSRMKGKTATLKKWGHVTQKMIADINKFEVVAAFAYNSDFDEKVFEFNCDYFKTSNPFDTIPIYDIRGHVHKAFAFTKEYQEFCEANKKFTEAGNYSTTAETVAQFLLDDTTFIEEHTALSDAQIETHILFECVNKGCEWCKEYTTYKTIPRKVNKTMKVYLDKELIGQFDYISKTARGGNIYLKSE